MKISIRDSEITEFLWVRLSRCSHLPHQNPLWPLMMAILLKLYTYEVLWYFYRHIVEKSLVTGLNFKAIELKVQILAQGWRALAISFLLGKRLERFQDQVQPKGSSIYKSGVLSNKYWVLGRAHPKKSAALSSNCSQKEQNKFKRVGSSIRGV